VKSLEFQTFIDLVTFDQNFVKIEHDIKKSQEVKKSLLSNVERLQDDFLNIKNAKSQARKSVDEKELHMKVLDDQESELKKKLESISNQKEYKSLEKETLTVNAERLQHEQELLVLWNKLDTLNENYESKQKVHEEQVSDFTTKITAVKTEILDSENQLNSLTTQRIDKQKDVPQEWLDMYVNMKGRVANPVVSVVDGSCDACFYSVTSRDLQKLRDSKLLQCRDCYRLLYVE